MGVFSKNEVYDMINKDANIPMPLVNDTLQVYHNHYYPVSLLFNKKNGGWIENAGKKYFLVYNDITRGELLTKFNTDPNLPVAISFRAPADNYDLINIAMVKG